MPLREPHDLHGKVFFFSGEASLYLIRTFFLCTGCPGDTCTERIEFGGISSHLRGYRDTKKKIIIIYILPQIIKTFFPVRNHFAQIKCFQNVTALVSFVVTDASFKFQVVFGTINVVIKFSPTFTQEQ